MTVEAVPTTQLSQVIAQATAPSFLLGAVSGFVAVLIGRMNGVLDRIRATDGFPELSEGFETSLPGLYTVGFLATRDFGPFYGFTKGCPSAAKLTVDEMLR